MIKNNIIKPEYIVHLIIGETEVGFKSEGTRFISVFMHLPLNCLINDNIN